MLQDRHKERVVNVSDAAATRLHAAGRCAWALPRVHLLMQPRMFLCYSMPAMPACDECHQSLIASERPRPAHAVLAGAGAT